MKDWPRRLTQLLLYRRGERGERCEGGVADISVCLKLRIYMTMCLAVAIDGKMSNEDAKHGSYIIAF